MSKLILCPPCPEGQSPLNHRGPSVRPEALEGHSQQGSGEFQPHARFVRYSSARTFESSPRKNLRRTRPRPTGQDWRQDVWPPPEGVLVSKPKVVITGIGAITPLGRTAEAFWEGLVAGRSGIGPMTLCDPTDYPCRISGEVSDFDPEGIRQLSGGPADGPVFPVGGGGRPDGGGIRRPRYVQRGPVPGWSGAGKRERRIPDFGGKLPDIGPTGRDEDVAPSFSR